MRWWNSEEPKALQEKAPHFTLGQMMVGVEGSS